MTSPITGSSPLELWCPVRSHDHAHGYAERVKITVDDSCAPLPRAKRRAEPDERIEHVIAGGPSDQQHREF